VRAARTCPGVLRIALVGSLVASKAIPKDADVLVTINGTMDLDELAHAGRRFKGSAQTILIKCRRHLHGHKGRAREIATGPVETGDKSLNSSISDLGYSLMRILIPIQRR
jgi:hypothetical protein